MPMGHFPSATFGRGTSNRLGWWTIWKSAVIRHARDCTGPSHSTVIGNIQRAFRFENFAQALSFTDRVGALAEKEGHHPSILTEWGRVTVRWWTHKIKGLHLNDFIMASQTDVAFKAMGRPPAKAV